MFLALAVGTQSQQECVKKIRFRSGYIYTTTASVIIILHVCTYMVDSNNRR